MTLELSGLSVTYDGFTLGPLDLSVGREVLAVLGPSGSGKTTLLSAVAGIVEPDGGTVSLDGRSLVGVPLDERGVGLVFQDGALFPHMSARENVAYAAPSPERVEELAALLEVESVLDRRPRALSGGERQRVALARTLAADPALLLLDEPLSSLDAPIRRRLREQLHELFASLDIPVVYVTHDQRAATVLGDRVAVVDEGRIEQVGPPDEILHRPRTATVARFTGSENVFEARVVGRDAAGVTLRTVALADETGVTFRAAAAPDTDDVTACIRPSRVRVEPLGTDTGGAAKIDAPSAPLIGTVRRRLNEGDEYRLVVDCDGATFVASVRPTAVETLPDVGAAVRVSIPPAAVHLID